MLSYCQDYDEQFPGSGGAVPSATYPYGQWIWANAAGAWNMTGSALYPYIKNTQIFLCPSRKNATPTGCTFEMNALCGGASLGGVDDVSGTCLYNEADCDDGACTYSDGGTGIGIHNGGSNVGFVDGHAKWLNVNDLKKQSLYTLATD